MSSTSKTILVRVIMILAIVIAVIYGLGRLLTSNVNSMTGINYHAGKIEARNNSSFSHSHSTSGNSIFRARRIAISRTDDHPVLEQAVTLMRDDLLALGFVDQVDVFGPNDIHEPGGLLYDAYLTLSIDVKQDDKLFVKRDFKATVHVAAGTMPFNSRSTYTDHLSTPGINYALNGELDHTSQSTQAGTPYKMIADNIGEELAGKLAEQFTEWHEEFGADVDWPNDLIGSYPDDLTIPWPDGVQLDAVVDGYGLMQHRHALWSIQTDRPGALVQAFHQAYTDAGWRIDQGAVIEDDERHGRYHFRAWNDAPFQIEVFEVRDDFGEREVGEVSRICVRYQHRFDRPETREVIDRLVETEANLPVLKYLNRQMDGEQRATYFRMLEDSQPTAPDDLLALARFKHGRHFAEEAKQYMMRASLFAYRAHDRSEFQGKLKKAAEEMGLDSQVVDPTITPELMKEFGYKHVDDLVGTQSTIGIDQAVQFFYVSQDKLNTVDLWLDDDPNASGTLRLNHYRRHGSGSTSWGSQSAMKSGDHIYCSWHVDTDSGGYTIHIRQSTDEPNRFEVDIVAEQDGQQSNS